MANVLTNLIPRLYEPLDRVSRELVGFINAVSRDSNAERAAKDETVTVPIVPASTATDVTPGVTPPDDGDVTMDSVDLTISKVRRVPVRWTGEDTRGLNNAGTLSTITEDRFEQAFRTLTNEVETDLAGTYVEASRAYGTAGTTPFGTTDDLSDVAGIMEILDVNGAPPTDRHLVLGTAAMFNVRGKMANLFKANEAGTDDLLRRGDIGEIEGMRIHSSAQVKSHTAGTGSGYLVNDVALSEGDTVIEVDTGTGTVLAGDVLTFATDAESGKYVTSTALSGTSLTIAKPGLLDDIDNSAAITLLAGYKANMGFHRSAIVLATRPPAMPEDGDMADDSFMLTDQRSGLTFDIRLYRQYHQIQFEVSLAWGFKLIKPEHTALLLG